MIHGDNIVSLIPICALRIVIFFFCSYLFVEVLIYLLLIVVLVKTDNVLGGVLAESLVSSRSSGTKGQRPGSYGHFVAPYALGPVTGEGLPATSVPPKNRVLRGYLGRQGKTSL